MTKSQKSMLGGISLLGMAGIICKVVGVLYRVPLANIAGPQGIAVYQQVFPFYNLLLTISSAGLPVAISRTVARYVERGVPRAARTVLRAALGMLTLFGCAATLLLLLLSGRLAEWVGTPEAAPGYMAIAPSLLLVCMMSAFRGYMQGNQRMTPTAVSQLIEQVGKVFIALPMAALGMRYGMSVSDAGFNAGMAYSAAGALLGTSVAEAAALSYMVIQYFADRRRHPDTSARLPRTIRNGTLNLRLIQFSIPVTLGACIVPLAGTVDAAMLVKLMQGIPEIASDAGVRYGIYSGLVIPLINVPTALAAAVSISLVPAVSAALARKCMRDVRQRSAMGLRFACLVGFPCSVGMSQLALPILTMLFQSKYSPEQLALGAELLSVSAMTIILFTLVQATSGILQGFGKQRIPMYTLMAGVAVKIALNFVLVQTPSVNIHGAPVASLCCYGVSLLPNLYYVKYYTGMKINWTELFVRPALATAIMALAIWGVTAAMGTGGAATCVAIFAAITVFAVSARLLGAIKQEDISSRMFKRLMRLVAVLWGALVLIGGLMALKRTLGLHNLSDTLVISLGAAVAAAIALLVLRVMKKRAYNKRRET